MSDNSKKILMGVLIAAFAVVLFGTIAIPAVLAFLFGWQWLFAYPVMLAVILVWASKNRRKG